jgi:hypothetical protein
MLNENDDDHTAYNSEKLVPRLSHQRTLPASQPPPRERAVAPAWLLFRAG